MEVDQPIDITAEQRKTILVLLDRHLPNTTAWAYGSRVRWTSRPQSDLDMVVFAKPEQKSRLADLREAFEESNLPLRVDLFVWDTVPEEFREQIKAEHVVLVEAEERRGNGWREVNIGEIAKLMRETVKPSNLGNTPYVGLKHIGENTLSLAGHGFARDVTSAKTRFSCGDILFGKLRPYFRKVVHTRFDGICSTDIWVIRAKEGIDQKFLFYHMASQSLVNFATSTSEGTRMPRAKWNYVSQYKIILPSLPEQRAIAHILGTLDDKIELNRRMNKTLEEMARALFKDWFVDFGPVRAKMEGRWRPGESLPGLPAHLYDLFPDRLVDSELGEIPEGWEVRFLGEMVELNPSEHLKRGIVSPYLNMAALPTSGPSPDEPVLRKFKSGTRFRNGDVLLARITPCLENGKTAFIQALSDHAVGWGSTEFIVMRAVSPIPPEYPYLLARDAAFREHAIQSMTGTSGRQRVQVHALAHYLIPSPRADLWRKFSSLMKPVFGSIEATRKESCFLAAQRDVLLPKLISGKLRIK